MPATFRPFWLLPLLALAPGVVAAQTDAPAETPAIPPARLTLELNGTADTDGQSCRLTLVAANHLPVGLSRAAWQVAIFDANGLVRALPVLDFGALIAGKTRVAVFDVPGGGCATIGRIVVNDVVDCRAADAGDQREACLAGLATQSRTPIEFGL